MNALELGDRGALAVAREEREAWAAELRAVRTVLGRRGRRGWVALSQAKAAAVCKVPLSTWQHWEQAVVRPGETVAAAVRLLLAMEEGARKAAASSTVNAVK